MIIDFNERLQQKQEQAEKEQHLEHIKELLTYCNQGEKEQLLEAMHNKDYTAWKEVTTPIIMRMAMVKTYKEMEGAR